MHGFFLEKRQGFVGEKGGTKIFLRRQDFLKEGFFVGEDSDLSIEKKQKQRFSFRNGVRRFIRGSTETFGCVEEFVTEYVYPV